MDLVWRQASDYNKDVLHGNGVANLGLERDPELYELKDEYAALQSALAFGEQIEQAREGATAITEASFVLQKRAAAVPVCDL